MNKFAEITISTDLYKRYAVFHFFNWVANANLSRTEDFEICQFSVGCTIDLVNI